MKYVAFVHTRRPQLFEHPKKPFLDAKLGPLDDRATRRLMTLLFRQLGLDIADDKSAEVLAQNTLTVTRPLRCSLRHS